MTGRTEHGWERHLQGDRPTSQAIRDRENAREVYLDTETGHTAYVGNNGRTHIFTPDGRHHTSFRTTDNGRRERVLNGKWVRQ
jgi:hypothetical protein